MTFEKVESTEQVGALVLVYAEAYEAPWLERKWRRQSAPRGRSSLSANVDRLRRYHLVFIEYMDKLVPAKSDLPGQLRGVLVPSEQHSLSPTPGRSGVINRSFSV